MFSGLPPRLRAITRLSLSASWVFAAAGGGAAIAFVPNPVVESWGDTLRYVWGGVLLMAGVTAAYGVLANKYRLEWGSSWFAAAASAPYAATLWVLTTHGNIDRLTGSFLMTSLILMFITRAVLCAAHAAKLRDATPTTPIPYVPGN